MDLHSISCFSGVGMLDEGLRAGLRYMGIALRTICHVEREAYSASVLAARMEEKSMDAAPIWSDILTFDARAWHGKVDCIVAGFPCQDLSIAGRRAGLDGKRSGLFFEVLRVADGCGAWLLVLENVAGIATATASVVDEAEGALEERAAARVVGELADRGWNAEWINLSASDVGASHGRARWFCVAWRMADTNGSRSTRIGRSGQSGVTEPCDELANTRCSTARRGEHFPGPSRIKAEYRAGDEVLGNARLQHLDLQQREDGAEHPGTVIAVAHAERAERRQECVSGTGGEQGNDRRRREADCRAGITGETLAIAECARWSQTGCRHSFDAGHEPEQGCCNLADASSSGSQERTRGGRNDEALQPTSRAVTASVHRLFAPGPSDAAWSDILAEQPWYRPALSIEGEHDAAAAFAATQPVFRGMADGLAAGLDFGSRAPRLKCVGNGVVALCAATAFVVLARRAGIFGGMKS